MITSTLMVTIEGGTAKSSDFLWLSTSRTLQEASRASFKRPRQTLRWRRFPGRYLSLTRQGLHVWNGETPQISDGIQSRDTLGIEPEPEEEEEAPLRSDQEIDAEVGVSVSTLDRIKAGYYQIVAILWTESFFRGEVALYVSSMLWNVTFFG